MRFMLANQVKSFKSIGKIDRLYNRNLQQEYVLQRMTEHTYFFNPNFMERCFM